MMNVPNPLPRFGLTRLSPSMLTLWRGNPKLWCVRYLLKKRDDSDMPKAWRGRAVEAGLNSWLYKRDARAAIVAQAEWDNAAQGVTSDEIETIRAGIPAMLGQAIETLKDRMVPTSSQRRLETWLPDVPVPCVGYCDWSWPDTILDLKTTERLPSSPSTDHAMQVGLYISAHETKGSLGELLYVTPKKSAIYRLSAEDVDRAVADARSAALSMLRFLDHARDPLDALSMLPTNRDHYAWTPELLDAAEAA